jgi:hypothetical protein
LSRADLPDARYERHVPRVSTMLDHSTVAITLDT